MATAYICPSCHLEQDTKDGFCRDCGTQVIHLRYCDSCGVKTRGPEDFCRECGTRLPAIVPYNAPTARVDSPASKPSPSVPTDTPAWLKGNDPPPAPASVPRRSSSTATRTSTKEDTPEWLRGAGRVDDSILTPRPSPVSPPAPRSATPRSNTNTNSPVLVRRQTPTPTNSANRNLQALLGLIFAILGVVTAPNTIIIGLGLIVIAMVVGGKPLLEMSTAGFHRVVDWIWEDPVLRKRMLDE
jgi:hypothetical protein